MTSSVFYQIPDGVIQEGYGEYLIYRVTAEGQKVAISGAEYGAIFDTIEESRRIEHGRYTWLEQKIQQKFDETVRLAFIPRTLYELCFLRECIENETRYKRCNSAHGTKFLQAVEGKEVDAKEVARERKERFWQICKFDDSDYIGGFTPKNQHDCRMAHIRKVATRLNAVAIRRCQADSDSSKGFSFGQIKHITEGLLQFFRKLYDEKDPNHKIRSWIKCATTMHVGITREFMSDSAHNYMFGPSTYAQGIKTDKHVAIIEKAVQLECSQEAVNSLILYRGSHIEKDSVTYDLTEGCYSLSYGISLFAGAIYDGGASAFQFMRQPTLDANAYVVPLEKLNRNETPFYAFNVHPIIQLLSQGEIFHPRTLVWKAAEDAPIAGILGKVVAYSQLKDVCKTNKSKGEIQSGHAAYKSKVYQLASKTEADLEFCPTELSQWQLGYPF